MTPNPEKHADASQPAQANLLALPPEIIVDIFHDVGIGSTSSRDLISLATSSRQLYSHFKAHEYILLRRILASLVQRPERSPLVDCLIKVGILYGRRPWPIGPKRVANALLSALTPLESIPDPRLYGAIVNHVRAKVYAICLDPSEEILWRSERFPFAVARGLAMPSREVTRHPFEKFSPKWLLNMRALDIGGLKKMVTWILNQYRDHAEVVLTQFERDLAEEPDWVPCCLAEMCPRFYRDEE